MILVDREDFEGLGLPNSLFYRKWEPGEPEAVACDYADVESPGPFLIKANDEAVWLSHGKGDWIKIATNTRYDGPEQKRWSHLATLYAEAAGLSLRSMTNRIRSVRQRLMKTPGRWVDWSPAYRWGTGSDLVWAGFIYHSRIETREVNGKKEVRYGSQ